MNFRIFKIIIMKTTKFEYPSLKPDAQYEDGEVDYLDESPYIVDPKFRFRTDSMIHNVNWRNIERINLAALKTATFDDINTVFR